MRRKQILEYNNEKANLQVIGTADHQAPHQQKEEKVKEQQVCDFCGKNLDNVISATTVSNKRAERRKYCSETCRSRAQRGWRSVRLGMPISKRYTTKLKFSSPLYFD